MHPEDTIICEETGGKYYENSGKLLPAIIRKYNEEELYNVLVKRIYYRGLINR